MAAILGAFIASISPFWGLIVIITYGGKYRDQFYRFLIFFLVAEVLLKVLNIVDFLTFTDVFFVVGAATLLYFSIYKRNGFHLAAILAAYVLNIVYAVIRHLVFGTMITENIGKMINTYRDMLENTWQSNSDQLAVALQILESSRQIFAKYYLGIWLLSIAFGLYCGTLIFSKQNIQKWHHKLIRLPYEMVYLVIATLVMFLIPNTRDLGINLLLILAPLFLIQGISILDFFWGNFFRKSKLLLFLLIISVVFNYFILSLIALFGLLDIWLNFRKIRVMEDIDENHSG
ncbi:MAG TPA: DUF2232 domain-containing protein [Candidatus Cloacimonadota bacterium]|nr:DUF2232 domain-containing protein [Candidatus Cloacimonadota bacterium]